MYRRRILCTSYGTLDFYIVLKKGVYGGGGGYWYITLLYVLLGRVGEVDFFGPKSNGTRFAVAISGPKKVSISRAHTFHCHS